MSTPFPLKILFSVVVFVTELSAPLEGKGSGVPCPTPQNNNISPPTVTVSVPENTTEVWFQNNTFKILQNMDLNLNLTCESTHPIQWVEIYDKESDGLGGASQSNLVKGLWNEVVQVEGDDLEYLYRSLFTVKHPGSTCSVSNFSCQVVENPTCFQSKVTLTLDKGTDLVTLTNYPGTENTNVNDPQGYDDEPCEAILSYWIHPMKPYYGWKCETASSGKTITDRNEFLICDSAAHCNTFYQNQRRGTKCLRRILECYYYCSYINENYYKPGFVTCRDQGVLLAQHFFYSVPQIPNETPEIYFDWTEADPYKMLVIEPLGNETYLGDNVTVFCQLSRYYFAYGHRFGVGHENGSVQLKDAIDGDYVPIYNTNRINITIELVDLGVVNVFCLAPVWNSTEWINQSVAINVLPDPEPPTFSDTDYQEVETLVWYVGDENKTISCTSQGKPFPTVSWTNFVSGTKYIENSLDKTSTEMEFPFVNEETDGEYVCRAENFVQVKHKVFRIVVIDRLKFLVKSVAFILTGVLLLCLGIMIICWKTIKDQRKQIRLLSEAEIKEFLEGNIDAVHSNDYLDTSDLIQSIPYNPKFEIPKEMIHIDESKVLGSGNFGQVLKGSIQLLQSKNGVGSTKTALKGMNSIDVAVKTVKHNMEVLYFKTLLSEVKIMAHIGKHPNIVSLVGACTQNIRKREIFIAVEFCTNGSLENFLRKERSAFVNLVKDDVILTMPKEYNSYENVEDGRESGVNATARQPITTRTLIKWCREIANGMEFLGSKKIIHGDLASRNVFLSDELIVKIGDFGLSRQLLNYSNYVKNQECPLPWKWLSLEALQEMRFSVFSDMWAYGITIWEVFTLGNVPYPGVTWSADFLDQLSNGMRMHKPSYATTHIYNTMLECWNIEPSRRPSFPNLKTFFEKLLVDNSPQNYFEPSLEGLLVRGPRDPSSSILLVSPNALSSPVDSGITEDTHGYLLPFLESETIHHA